MDQKILIFFSLVFFYPNRWVFYLMVHSMMIMIVSCICNLLREFSLYVYKHNIGICFIKWKTFASSNVFQLNIVRDILECIQSLKNVHETNENWTIVFTKRKKNCDKSCRFPIMTVMNDLVCSILVIFLLSFSLYVLQSKISHFRYFEFFFL